jgi:hypothetical protein
MTDPDKIMAEHRGYAGACLLGCGPWPCEPYLLAEWLKIAEDEHKRLSAENAALRAAKRDHDLANGGCVPKPAYDELAAEYAALRAAIKRVRDLATDWSDAACEARSDRLSYRAANRQLRAALALPEGER